MVIEIVGLPGSGKTTLLKKIKKDFPSSFLNFDDAYKRYFYNLTIFKIVHKIFKKKVLFLRFFSIIFLLDTLKSYFKLKKTLKVIKLTIAKRLNKSKNEKKFLRLMIKRTLLQDIFRRKYKNEVMIFEEGILQILLTFMEDINVLNKIKINISKAIIIKTSPHECYSRMLTREDGFPWEEGLYKESRQEELERRYKNLSLIEKQLLISNIQTLKLEFVLKDYSEEAIFEFLKS